MSLIVRVTVDRSGVIEESLRIRGSLCRLSFTWIGRSFVRLSRGCVVFSCVARRVSLTSDVARCFDLFAGTRGRRWYLHVFSSYKSCSVRRRFSFFVNLSLSFFVISLFLFSFSRFGVSIFILVFVSLRIVVSFVVSFSFSVSRVRRASAYFRRGASFSFRFPSSYVVLRPVRLRSLARSLIVLFAPSFMFVPRFSNDVAG